MVPEFKALLATLTFILRHPLNRKTPLAALGRFLTWQLGSRLLPGAVAVPFVEDTRLIVRRGMTGATGNLYCGLHEFEDMALLLHALRPGDLFVDIGANVGSYTVLAAGVCGAKVMALEPVPATFERLLDNLRINPIGAKVEPKHMAVGAASGTVRFTTDLDTVNHVCTEAETGMEVPLETLDRLLDGLFPVLIKIDVEGYESQVVKGGLNTLGKPGLLAVLMEFNGSGMRYGHDESELLAELLDLGFTACVYWPFERRIEPVSGRIVGNGNILFARDIEALRKRVATARKITVLGQEI